jgi:3-methyladenine DNA glycosylase AlkD
MTDIIHQLRSELESGSSESGIKSGKRFFKEEIRLYGLKSDLVRKISLEGFEQIRGLGRERIFSLCEILWKSGFLEESFIACEWAYHLKKEFKPEDFIIFEHWLNRYVNNWASCDTLCNHTIGTFIEMYPRFLPELKKWAGSGNRWVRRGSAVTLIIPARKGKFHDDIEEIADILLEDKDDLVQKAYGWMLKAASQYDQKRIFEYVLRNKKRMPRTALRYAIEKMSPELKKIAMQK